MKKCPTCGAVVVKADYCPICRTCVVYEESFSDDRYKPPWNAYVLRHYLKKLALPAAGFLIVAVFTILTAATGRSFHGMIIFAWILAASALLCGVFEDRIVTMNLAFYTEKYARLRVRAANGAQSLLAAALILFDFFAL